MEDFIETMIGFFFSVLPVIVILIIVFTKKVGTPENQKQLPKNTETNAGNESELEKILREIREQMNNATNKPLKSSQENQSYELTTYENNNKEIQNYENNSRETQSYEQSYETVSYEENYEDDYEEEEKNYEKEKEKPKSKMKIMPIIRPPVTSSKKHIERRAKNVISTNKEDIKRAFIISELLKPKF